LQQANDFAHCQSESDILALIPRPETTPKMSLKNFTVNECIGQGNFGQIYRAVENSTKKEYALKAISLDKIETK